jgi:hypothetical protein
MSRYEMPEIRSRAKQPPPVSGPNNRRSRITAMDKSKLIPQPAAVAI